MSALSFDETPSDDAAGEVRLAIGLESGGWEVVHIATASLGAKHTTATAFPSSASSSSASPLIAFESQVAVHAEPASDPPRRVNDLRFSPDARYLAIASADAIIYLHDAIDGHYSLVARCCGHSSGITHIDWTTTSDVLRSNDLGHELRFWDVPTGEAISVASACRDLPWATNRVTLGYHCQGIFRNRADGTGVHAVDCSADGDLLVTADDSGLINLFRYPCVRASGRPDAPGHPNRKSFAAHASAALDCSWGRDGAGGADDACVVTVGGYDLTLMQWRKRKLAPGA